MTSKNVRTPAGLGAAGRRIFRQISAGYALRADEFVVLEAASHTADLVDRLQDALIGQPLITAGVGGQDRVNPLLVELRQQRVALAGLMRQLHLPEEGAAAPVNQQRAAGAASWASRAGSTR